MQPVSFSTARFLMPRFASSAKPGRQSAPVESPPPDSFSRSPAPTPKPRFGMAFSKGGAAKRGLPIIPDDSRPPRLYMLSLAQQARQMPLEERVPYLFETLEEAQKHGLSLNDDAHDPYRVLAEVILDQATPRSVLEDIAMRLETSYFMLRPYEERWLLNRLEPLHAETPEARAMLEAAYNGDEKCVKAMLKAGVHPDTTNDSGDAALPIAAGRENYKAVKALLEAGASVDAKNEVGTTALMMAAGHGDTRMLNLLLKYQADVNVKNQSGATPLGRAIDSGHETVIRKLLAKEADVHTRIWNDRTTLMAAVSKSMPWLVKYLRSAGVDVNARSLTGSTALHEAAANGNVAIIRELLKPDPATGAKADLEIEDKLGERPLMRAAANGHLKAVQALVEAGADVNAQHVSFNGNYRGMAALMYAAQSGHLEIVKWLIGQDADVNAVANAPVVPFSVKITALSLAKTPEIKVVLRKASAREPEAFI